MPFLIRLLYINAIVLLPFCSLANLAITYVVNKGDVHLEYRSGWEKLELGKKIRIFTELADKLKTENFPNSKSIYIYFGHDITKSDTSYYAVGFGEFKYLDFEKYKYSKAIKAEGIKLIIRDGEFDIKKMLLLVNAALSNIDLIKDNQTKHIIKTNYYCTDTVNSIAFNLAQSYLTTPNVTVEKLLTEKLYRNIKKAEDPWEIDYYFQNNKFHFYNTNPPKEEWSIEQGKRVVTKTFGEDIFSVDNIYEIVGNIYDGYFIFTTESNFYYLPQSKKNVGGPYKIDSNWVGRPPLVKYYHETIPIKHFVLFMDNNRNHDKILFIPDSNTVISNYSELEEEFFSRILEKPQTTKEKNFKFQKTTVILTTLLSISLLIIITLILKQQSVKHT